jgi:uncharacterized protein YegL
MPIVNAEFATNPDPRCACVLLLDTSGSMEGDPIKALNQGLAAFQQDLQDDLLASRRVEIAIVTFGAGGVQKVHDFVIAREFMAPTLSAAGETPMGAAINIGLDMVTERKAQYKAGGVSYYQPWVFMITDGAPTDGEAWVSAAQRTQAAMAAKGLVFFAVGVANANMDTLSRITPRTLKLDGLKFRELFLWLSQSQKRVSGSKVGEQVAMPKVDFDSPV